jgi:hypothetical protein
MIEYSYLENAKDDYKDFSKYYDGTFKEFIKSRFDLVDKFDVVYFAPCGLIDNDDIIFTT